jgi:hypothetical protein
LPLFIDDLFAKLTEPVCVFAAAEVIEILERDFLTGRFIRAFRSLQMITARF